MAARTGEQFLRGLRDGRELWVGGDRVGSIVDHPALSGAAQALAEVYDLQHQAADVCLMPDPETGEKINVSHMIPRSRDDILKRHRGLERVAEYSVGLMGRTPDYMNVTYAGFAGRCDEWAINGNEEGSANLVHYQKKLAREDIALTHTIVHATVDLAKGKYPVGFDPVQLHKVEDTAHGIVVRGSRVLATLAPFADELAVYPGGPMPDAADAHALSFCIPMGTPGLKFICRDSVAVNSNRFEHPLSTRFDEQDAFVIFDDVEVPRERLFINANLAVYNSVMKTTWWPNIMQQTMIRAQTKLEFAWGLANRMAEVINLNQPQTQQMLGEIAMFTEFARAAVFAAEQRARPYGNGMWACDVRPLAALRAALPAWFPRVNEIIRLIGSHNLLTTPARAAFADKALRPLIDRYLRGVGVDAEQRSRLFRLAWDFAGTALGSRNEQYERFYLGSIGRNLAVAQTTFDRGRADRLLDRFLKEPLDDAPTAADMPRLQAAGS
ncbi:MAG TPA: 4-hydroxyphenylacetate 3-hydroxylase N-terminal domain-containing protein [Vineibacter sp.]|nr:4-hydroxyphenylacetate 3-hydroxylase N-terminal domain-containing protein [Vineibacter sp.]